MWAIITGVFMFFMAIIFSLGKASSKREDVAHNHREELLARNKDSEAEEKRIESTKPEAIEQHQKNKKRKTPHPSEQL